MNNVMRRNSTSRLPQAVSAAVSDRRAPTCVEFALCRCIGEPLASMRMWREQWRQSGAGLITLYRRRSQNSRCGGTRIGVVGILKKVGTGEGSKLPP